MNQGRKVWKRWLGVAAVIVVGAGAYGLHARLGSHRGELSPTQKKEVVSGTGDSSVHWSNNSSSLSSTAKPQSYVVPRVLGLRKFPYPYEAMLALSSDADHETLRKFNLVHQFINTEQLTPSGYYGVGLPFADSFFMYNGSNTDKLIDAGGVRKPHELSWFKGTSQVPYAAAILNHYIHVGWIDTLHSWGDFTGKDPYKTKFRRQLAEQGVRALEADGDYLTVWTDHGNQSNVDDMGSYGTKPFFWYQQGANPWSKYYHANITIPYGVRFVWSDKPDSSVGLPSMIYPLKLPNGDKVWGFWRYTSVGVSKRGYTEWDWTVGDLGMQINRAHLLWLERHHDYSIVAQHLEALNDKYPLPPNAINALQLLAEQYRQKKILVATTSQLLNYNVTQQYVHYTTTYQNGKAYIHIENIHDSVDGTYKPTLSDVRGLTFYTTNPAETVIEIGNTPVPSRFIVDNPSDGVAKSISIRWFHWSTKNYAISSKTID
ncbi:MAG: hypothetical protein OWS03_01080 [Alicyclobacillaceae bacterium]|nr:hypothetical protein [Alicyclobacillaceae bacterium]